MVGNPLEGGVASSACTGCGFVKEVPGGKVVASQPSFHHGAGAISRGVVHDEDLGHRLALEQDGVEAPLDEGGGLVGGDDDGGVHGWDWHGMTGFTPSPTGVSGRRGSRFRGRTNR